MLEIGKILRAKPLAKVFLACFCVFQLLLTVVPAHLAQAASAPNIINYQGRVLNANGIPVADSSLNMIFELYTAVSGGSCVWSNSSATCASATARSVTLTDGLFSEGLGDTVESYAAITDSIFGNNASLFLQITVAGEVLTPRKQIAAAPYALNSDTLDGLDADTDGATSSAIVALNSSGNAIFTGDPTGATVSTGVVYVNPAAAAADETIIGIGDNGADRFRVDKEGDVFIKTIELDGVGVSNATSGASLVGVYDELALSSGTNVQDVLDDLDQAIDDIVTGGAVSKWTDSGTFTYLTATADDLVIGDSTVAGASMFFDESVGQLDLGTDSALAGSLRLYSVTAATSDPVLAADATGNLDITATAVELSGDLAVTGGDLTSTSGTFNLLDASGNSTTLEIGGVTTDLGNTISVATNSTTADTITIGNSNAATTMALTGGDDWSIAATGVVTLSASAAATTALVITDTDYTNALSIGDNIITGSTSAIDFSNFDVATSGEITVAVTQGLDTNAAGALRLGQTNATSVGICNSAACDVISLGATTDADSIVIGEVNDNIAITEADWSISPAGLITTADDIAVNGGDFTSTSATVNLFDSAAGATTIELGGVTTDLGNTVSIATNSTTADTISIGNSNASTTMALTGGNDWSVTTGGTGTFTDLVCVDCLDFSDLSDTLTVDADTTVTLGTRSLTFGVTDADLTVNLTGSAGFTVNDSSGSFVQFQAIGSVFITPSVADSESLLLRTTAVTTGNIFALDVNDTGLTSADYISADHTVTYTSTATVSANATSLNRALTNNTGGLLTVSGDMLSITSANANTSGTLTDTADLIQLTQSNTAATGAGLRVVNQGTGSSVFVDPSGNTGTTVSTTLGGAVHIDNTSNDNYGLTVYSNNTGGVASPLAFVHADNTAFDVNVAEIRNDSNSVTSSSALVITQDVVADATTAATSQALVLKVNEAGGNDEVMLVLSDADGTPDAEFRLENDGDLFADGAAYNSGADYAEFFYSLDSSLGDHEIVCQDSANNLAVKACDLADPTVIGVISTSPGFVGNNIPGAEGSLEDNPNYRIVGLEGQIDTYVTAADGAISVGDALTASGVVEGFAGKATSAGRIVGFALEPLASGSGLIKVRVSPGWDGGEILSASGELTSVGTTLALESLSAATALSPVSDSHGLAFRGSVWNGTSAQALAMTVSNKVTSASNYRLSVANDAGSEVAYINNLGDLVLSGKLYPSNQGNAQTAAYIYYDSSGVGYMRTNAAGWGTGSYDFAEMFPSPETLQPGDVVVFGNGDQQVKKSTGETYDDRIAGVVSTRPGFVAGNTKPGDSPIALSGRVPTRVNAENGAIAIGDPLTTSSTPGVAMKATEPGPIVGYAMQSFSEGEGSVIAFIRASYYDGQGSHVPQLVSAPVSQVTNAGNLTSLTLNGGNITSVASISGLGNSWRLTELGDLRTYGRVIQIVKSHQNEDVETYAAASRQMTIELSGTATLTGNAAVIKFEDIDPQFNDIISTTSPYRVLATPGGVTGQIYVTDRTNSGFTIQSENSADGILVDWMVIAPHKDYEPAELEPTSDEPVAEEPVVDPIVTPEPEVAGVTTEEPTPPVESSEPTVDVAPVDVQVPVEPVVDVTVTSPVVIDEIPAAEIVPDPEVEPTPEVIVSP